VLCSALLFKPEGEIKDVDEFINECRVLKHNELLKLGLLNNDKCERRIVVVSHECIVASLLKRFNVVTEDFQRPKKILRLYRKALRRKTVGIALQVSSFRNLYAVITRYFVVVLFIYKRIDLSLLYNIFPLARVSRRNIYLATTLTQLATS